MRKVMQMTDAFDKLIIKNFLEDQDCEWIAVPYKGKRLNAPYDWRKLRGSSAMLLRAFFNEILRKVPPCSLKNSIYRLMGVKIGKDVVIGPGVSLDPLFPKLIVIEDGAVLGWGSQVLTHEFLIEGLILGRVCIKKKALIGDRCLIRMGTIIGNGATVSMYSLVNKDVADNKAVGGVPAKPIKIKKHF